ncbi:hypothetical protein RAA17_13740 [Komagataeibacter rhaeticus]|nr:hypothetical protein [Komagataeibacter rhaeticus]
MHEGCFLHARGNGCRMGRVRPCMVLHAPCHPAGHAGGGTGEAHAFYTTHGAALGHSPNAFFDETWYRQAYPGVARAIAQGIWPSGFAHYLQAGLRTHSPHWLFDEHAYRATCPDLTQAVMEDGGYRNGYDHYLRAGDGEMRTGSCFSIPSPALPLYSENGRDAAAHPFVDYLLRGMAAMPDRAVSVYFDAGWYVRTYPAVQAAIDRGMAVRPAPLPVQYHAAGV